MIEEPLSPAAEQERNLGLLGPAIARSEAWMVACWALIDGIRYETTERRRVSISLHHLSIEHQSGIHVLVSNGVFGSAFALFRPQLEAYLRALWMYLCADDAAVARFLRGIEPPRVGALIRSLELHEPFTDGRLTTLKRTTWDSLCALTHGGLIQVLARNRGDQVVQRYRVEHVAGLLEASATLGLLASVGMAAVVDDEALAARLAAAHHHATLGENAGAPIEPFPIRRGLA